MQVLQNYSPCHINTYKNKNMWESIQELIKQQ